MQFERNCSGKSELQIVHSDSYRCLAQAFISSVLTHSTSWIIPAAIINTLHLTEAHSIQDLSTINRGKHQLRSMHHRESSCPPHCYPSSIHPPSLKKQGTLHLYDGKSVTNLAAICWDIFSFHVRHFFGVFGDACVLKGWGTLKASASLYMFVFPISYYCFWSES